MKLAEAIAQDLPFELLFGDSERPLPVAWLWELRKGGIAYVFGGYQISPSAESHMHRGTVVGEGPWRLLDRDRENEDGTPLQVVADRLPILARPFLRSKYSNYRSGPIGARLFSPQLSQQSPLDQATPAWNA